MPSIVQRWPIQYYFGKLMGNELKHIWLVLMQVLAFDVYIFHPLASGSSYSWFPNPSDLHPMIHDSFLSLWCHKMTQVVLYIPCSIPKISHFPKKPWFPLVEVEIVDQYQATMDWCLLDQLSFLGLYSGTSWVQNFMSISNSLLQGFP